MPALSVAIGINVAKSCGSRAEHVCMPVSEKVLDLNDLSITPRMENMIPLLNEESGCGEVMKQKEVFDTRLVTEYFFRVKSVRGRSGE